MCKESEEEKRGKFCDLDVFMICLSRGRGMEEEIYLAETELFVRASRQWTRRRMYL